MHQLQHTLAQVSARGQCRFKHIRRCRGIIDHHAHPEWALEEACCALPHTGLQYHTLSHSQRACSAAQQTAPQARSGDPARILSQLWRWTRRSSSPVDVWPPSQSRGAASAYLERRLHPSTSSSRKRTISSKKSQLSRGNQKNRQCPKKSFFGPLAGGFSSRHAQNYRSKLPICVSFFISAQMKFAFLGWAFFAF